MFQENDWQCCLQSTCYCNNSEHVGTCVSTSGYRGDILTIKVYMAEAKGCAVRRRGGAFMYLF